MRQSIGYIEATPDKDTMVELIKTLQSVTEGKIYVEIERARLTRRLAKIKEAEGKIDEAADTLQEVAVVRSTSLTNLCQNLASTGCTSVYISTCISPACSPTHWPSHLPTRHPPADRTFFDTTRCIT